MPEYVIFRNGSNSANQPRTQRMLVWAGEAENEEDAKLRARRGGVKCYNNQYLDVLQVDELEGEDYAEYNNSMQTVHLQPFAIPEQLHSDMKSLALRAGKTLKEWRIEAYREKIEREKKLIDTAGKP